MGGIAWAKGDAAPVCGLIGGLFAAALPGAGGDGYFATVVWATALVGLALGCALVFGFPRRRAVSAIEGTACAMFVVIGLGEWGLGLRLFETGNFDAELCRRFGLFAAAAVGLSLGRSAQSVKWILRGMLCIGAMWALMEAANFAGAAGSAAPWVRLGGAMRNPNVLATSFACLWLIGLAETVCVLRAQHLSAGLRVAVAVLLVAALHVLGWGILLTQSRLALLAMVPGALWIALAAVPDMRVAIAGSRRLVTSLLGIAAVEGVLALAAGLSLLAVRLEQLPQDVALRWGLYRRLIGLSFANPVWGNGLGTFRQINEATLDMQDAVHHWNLGAAHNFVLGAALEAGWLYVALGGLALVQFGRLIWRRCRVRPLHLRELGMVQAIVVCAFCGFFDIALDYFSLGALCFLFLGLLAGRSSHILASRRRRSVSPLGLEHCRNRAQADRKIVTQRFAPGIEGIEPDAGFVRQIVPAADLP